jgi:cytochrome c peroxidase
MRSYPLLVVILLIGFAVMSFNPVYKGKESENTFINKGLSDFKVKLEQLKSDAKVL